MRRDWEAAFEAVHSPFPVSASTRRHRWRVDYTARHRPTRPFSTSMAAVFASVRCRRTRTDRAVAVARAAACLHQLSPAPEHRFPAALDDALVAYAGCSTGTAAFQRRLRRRLRRRQSRASAMLSLRDRGLPLPVAGLLMSPWTRISRQPAQLRQSRRGRSDPSAPMILALAKNIWVSVATRAIPGVAALCRPQGAAAAVDSGGEREPCWMMLRCLPTRRAWPVSIPSCKSGTA